jgi:hypothetical protein
VLLSPHGAARQARARNYSPRQRCRGIGREADVSYRVWVRAWTVREEVFEDRNSAELFRLRLAASRPSLSPGDVAVAAERVTASGLPASPGVQGRAPAGGLGDISH